MNARLLALFASGVVLLAILITLQSMLVTTPMELWYQHSSYINSDEAVQKSKDLIDKAAAAGYTGALFWDSSFNMMGNRDWDPANAPRMKEVLEYARQHHLKTVAEAAPFGWSNDVLAVDPNWAEVQRVVGARFQVSADGHSLKIKNTSPPLANGDFSAGQTAWFDLHDPNLKVTPNAHAGTAAVTIVDPSRNARIRQRIAVQPWRQYHLCFFYQATGSQLGSPMAVVYDGSNMQKVRFEANLSESADWTQFHYLFNSQDSTDILLYLGVWGGAKGTIQFSGVNLEETGPVYVAHREGAPFKLYDPNNPSKVYRVALDYNEVVDPQMLPHRPCFTDNFHAPPPFTLPNTTELKPGQIVAADYYAATPLINANQMGMCMTDSGVFHWLTQNAQKMHNVVPFDSGLLLYYDEIRHANSCSSCRQKHMTAGELLAWNFGKTSEIYHNALPKSDLWVWSDMFDPFHNARDNVAYVEGTLAGSWKGLPAEVSIMNWNLDHLKDSLTWFSGLNSDQPVAHQQIIAGFYDRADAAAEARTEVAAAVGIPGIRGLMYTTWSNNYSQLQAFADAARAAWPDYARSAPKR